MTSIYERTLPFCLAVLLAGAGLSASAADAPAKASTALPGVSLLSPQLDMPGLKRQRQVRLYLPPGYATSGKRYPVLYMHDAQNLFDNATAYAGEWKVDETLDALSKAGQLDLIVVGIDNGQSHRMTELNAWHNPRFGPAPEGREYMDFIVKVVKPLIDSRYRTLPDRANTAIMGSSMGGLVSHYAIAQYPEVFSKAGVFSPAYWTAQESFDFVAGRPLPKDARVFMLMGEKEGDSMVPDVERMAAVVRKTGHPERNLVLKIVPGAQHNEGFWSGEFREAVLWLFKPETSQHAAR
ncbi:MAG TPA: alpha/beta hydrolase-fold protein [Telluria sp.]